MIGLTPGVPVQAGLTKRVAEHRATVELAGAVLALKPEHHHIAVFLAGEKMPRVGTELPLQLARWFDSILLGQGAGTELGHNQKNGKA